MTASMPAPREPDAEDAATDVDPALPRAARPVQVLPPVSDASTAEEKAPQTPAASPRKKAPARKPAAKKTTAAQKDAEGGAAPRTTAPRTPSKPRKPAAPRATTSARAASASTDAAAESAPAKPAAKSTPSKSAAKSTPSKSAATSPAAKSSAKSSGAATSGAKSSGAAKASAAKASAAKSASGAKASAAKSGTGRTKKSPATPPPPPLPADIVEADGETIIVPPRPPLPAPSPAETPESAAPSEPAVAEPETPEAQRLLAAESSAADAAVPTEVAEPEVAETEPAPAAEAEPAVEPEATVTEAAETEAAVADVVEPAAAEVDETPVVVEEPAPSAAADEAGAADAAASVPALALRGVTKIFGDARAVDGIDLTVPAGTFYGLVGPNGAGKTTTLSMIAGLLQADRGTISVNGVDAAKNPQAAKRAMGVLPDRLRTFDRLTGRQLLYYYGVLRGLAPAVVESRTVDLARAFDLTDALGRVVSDYSAGMTKKVMLAGAMIHSPRLLVLDEPFEAVDPVSSAIILDILGAYVARGGTVVLSSHGMELVERVCTRVGVLVAGQVLAEGTIDEVRGELTLEQRFIELAGGLGDVEGLEWLHTFSD